MCRHSVELAGRSSWRRLAVDEAAAVFELGEPRRRRERRNPAEIEFFEAREGPERGREVDDGIGTEIEEAQFVQAGEGVWKRR